MSATKTNRPEELVRIAARLFREQGYAATSIRDLGEASGTTSAALYYHFANKEELLLAVIETGLKLVLSTMEKAVAQQQGVLDKLQVAMRAHLHSSLENQDFAVVVLQASRFLSPDRRQEVDALRVQYDALWDDLFLAGQREGLFKSDLDSKLLRKLIFGAMNNVVFWYRPEGGYSIDEISDTFLGWIMEGVMKEEAA